MRFAIAYWHTFCGTGEDPFGPGTQIFPWAKGSNAIERAKNKMDAAFEFITKIGLPTIAFMTLMWSQKATSVREYESNMQTMVEYAKPETEAIPGSNCSGEPPMFSQIHAT